MTYHSKKWESLMEQRQQHRESPTERSERVKKLSAPSSRPRWIGLIIRVVAVVFVIVIVLFIILSFLRAILLSFSALLILLLVVIGFGLMLSGFLPKWVRGMMGEVVGWCLKFVFRLCLRFLALLVQVLRWPLAMQILSRSANHVPKWSGQFRGSSGEEALGHAVLGHVVDGNLPWCLGSRLVLPAEELSKHGVVIGASGSGKTISLLRLAYVAARVYGYRVESVQSYPWINVTLHRGRAFVQGHSTGPKVESESDVEAERQCLSSRFSPFCKAFCKG